MRGIALTSLLPLPKQIKHTKPFARDAGKVGQKLRNLSFASTMQSCAVFKKFHTSGGMLDEVGSI